MEIAARETLTYSGWGQKFESFCFSVLLCTLIFLQKASCRGLNEREASRSDGKMKEVEGKSFLAAHKSGKDSYYSGVKV